MTDLEAQKILLNLKTNEKIDSVEKVDALRHAIFSLGKLIPRSPKKVESHSTVCPGCGRFIDRHEQKHGNIDIPCCKWCGQSIMWESD